MINFLFAQIRGTFSLFLYFVNTLFWVIPIFIFALIKLFIPVLPVRKLCDRVLNHSANNWILINNMTQRLFCDIQWHVYGLEDIKPDDWYLVVSNHQSWVDILVLQKIFHRKIPFLKFFLKKELFWFPVLGQAWWALDFPFMKRYSQQYLKKHPHLKGRDLEITRKACEKFKTIPVSVMNFVEGTRFSKNKHRRQQSPYENLLKPRAGGIAYVLSAMGEHLNSFIDVTIAYPQGAQTFWDYLCGNVRDVRVQVKSIPITPDMLGDYFNDRHFRILFQKWLNDLWKQKDQCIRELIASENTISTMTADSLPPLPRFPKIIPATDDILSGEEIAAPISEPLP